MERNLTVNQVSKEVGVPPWKIGKMARDGKIKFDRPTPRRTLYSLDEVKKAIAGRASQLGGEEHRGKGTAHDESDPHFDLLEVDEEEKLAEAEQEALEASRDAIETIYLNHIQKYRRKKHRGLCRKLMAKLIEVQAELDEFNKAAASE
jgi:hypothetical protein